MIKVRVPGLSFLILISFLAGSVRAQSYQFFNYELADGLCDKFAYTVNQDRQGFLWVGTSQGLCRFDGTSFDQVVRGDSVPASIAYTSLLDSKGRLWFGHANGLVSMLENGSFTLIDPSDDFQSQVMDIREGRDGEILVLCQQSGILRIHEDLTLSYVGDPADEQSPFANMFLNSFLITPEGNLLVGSSDGLSIYRYDDDLDSYIQTGSVAELDYLLVQVIVPGLRESTYWVGTEDEGLFLLSGEGHDPEAFSIEKLGMGLGLDYAQVRDIAFDGDRRVWISDWMTGVHRFELDREGNLGNSTLFGDGSGLPNTYINDIFIDEEGNQWFSTNGEGISVLRDQAFTFFSLWDEDRYEPDATALSLNKDVNWFAGESILARMPVGHSDAMEYLGPEDGLPDDKITALFQDERGDLFIGTDHNGLHVLRKGSRRIVPMVVSRNSLENSISAMDGTRDTLYVATNNGAYALSFVTGNRTTYSTVNGLPYNKINDILVDANGNPWVATITSGILTADASERFMIDGRPKIEFKTLIQDDRGDIWAGTDGEGVFRFGSDSLILYNVERGLKSDFCYALSIDPKGYVWVGHRLGMSRIDPGTGQIRTFGKEEGFSSDISHNASGVDEEGRMFMGSSEGIIRYDAFQAKEDTIPPRLSLKSVVISDVSYDPGKDIRLKYDKYRVRIDFVGINLSNPDQVRYQYKMKNYQDEWSDPSTLPWAYFPVVADGDYTFMLRACDGNGNCTEVPLSLDISVKIPIWKAWWFITTLALMVLAAIFIVFKIRERNQKAIQDYLQKQLDERTREVVHQKEEIEIKNRDITDSINYAQRIQASILPPIKKLHDTFTGSFVFYQPRDIVSGDFYWYEKTAENKFLIVCADSTGHGVPGAFMSMIGTTLIKDICLRSTIQTPAQVLHTLDNEVREALNQNIETSGSNDGMDIIVAEVDLETYRFTVASAMRPVIIYSGDEQIYVKGSRSSIGGQMDEDRLEKDFEDQSYNLKKGDIIYMFSDGYPDQFGGPLGRKFKMVRLKNLLRDIHDKPMEEQYNYIKSNFFLWKEDLEQVDDVLFMGIKL
ncbi:MAG: two-component regulator propeller domain-containing protein [Bacteroidales bacterium]